MNADRSATWQELSASLVSHEAWWKEAAQDNRTVNRQLQLDKHGSIHLQTSFSGGVALCFRVPQLSLHRARSKSIHFAYNTARR